MTPDEPQNSRGRSFEETLSDPFNESKSVAATRPDTGNTAQFDPPLREIQTLEFARPTDANTISDTANNVALDVNLSEADDANLNVRLIISQENRAPNTDQVIEFPTLNVSDTTGDNRVNVLTVTDAPAVKLPFNQSLSLPASTPPLTQTLTITPTGENGEMVRTVSTSEIAEIYVIAEDASDLRVLSATPPPANVTIDLATVSLSPEAKMSIPTATNALPQTIAMATASADADTREVPLPAVQTSAQAVEDTDTLIPKAEAKADSSDRPTLSTRAADTADYRALAQSPSRPSESVKLADAPTQFMSALTNSDTPAPAKSLPVMTALPTLSPLTGMSDRLAATIMQTTQAQPTFTLDKLPQTVVAIALSARSATLQIDPPELGRIQLDYQFDSQGRTVVTLTPESDAARAALMDRMASIVAALEQGSDKPIDVRMGDARNFGSEFDQTSQDDRGSGSNTKDGANPVTSEHAPSHDSQRFMRAPLGEAERLHILV